MLTDLEQTAVRHLARTVGVPWASMMAVIEVESGGKAYTLIEGEKLPLIRWEGHYFDRYVAPAKRDEARKAGLAHPTAGKIKNPSSQRERYKLFERACRIDRKAAIMSCSWGVGQVMGSHWRTLEYASPEDLYRKVTEEVVGQIDLMVRYIVKFGLIDELRDHDWTGFARGYNGPQYAKYGYHRKLEAAFARYNNSASPVPAATGVLRLGSKGAAVREVQRLLVRAGASINIDGDFGPATRDAVRAFQKSKELHVDGKVGRETMAALNEYRTSPDEDLTSVPATANPDVTGGAVSTAGGIGAAVAADKLTDIADKIGTTGIAALDYAVTGLYVLSAVLVIGGIGWAVYGHVVKARRTFEGLA